MDAMVRTGPNGTIWEAPVSNKKRIIKIGQPVKTQVSIFEDG